VLLDDGADQSFGYSVTRFVSIAGLLVGILLFDAISGSTSAQQGITGVARVAWMQGCWETSSPQRTIEEHWMSPRGGSMLGVGRTVRDGRLIEYEMILLSERGDRLAYEAHPSGQTPATFMSSTVTSSAVVFENPEHDFPQRIGYERKGADSLTAWVEGPQNGRTRRIEFAYTRARCPQ
jgi:Domain of unknown function (DUF6265)